MSWTTVPKPTGTNYTNVNPVGKEQYDQPSIMYNDPNVFYDGVNQNQWTDVAKPTSPAQYGPELVVNGTFDGNADNWILDTNWSYGDHNIVHIPSTQDSAKQDIGIESIKNYRLIFNLQTLSGNQLEVAGLNDGEESEFFVVSYEANEGSQPGIKTIDFNTPTDIGSGIMTLRFQGFSTFNGSLTNVSLKEIISFSQWTKVPKPS